MNGPGDRTARISVPAYAGERYEAEVPDTLDLVERAVLAINAMTRVGDADRDGELFFMTEFAEDPPKLYHEWSGIFNTTKFLESLPLMRIMSGSDYNLDVDAKLMGSYLRGAGKDGLYYRPVEHRPWSFCSMQGHEAVKTTRDPYCFIFGEGRLIMAMCMWYRRDRNELWRTLIEAKIQRLLQMGYRKGDAICFDRIIVPGHVIAKEPPVGAVSLDSWVPYGVMEYYRLTGYEPALDLARRQVNHLRSWFGTNGRFLEYHFHLSTAALIDILEYAVTVNDRALVELVGNAYAFAKEIGEPLVGFFPEVVRKSYPACESCDVADMVFLALRLTEAGQGDYWEDVDRWVRNQFIENQMTRTDWVDYEKIMALQTDEAKDRIARQIETARKMPGIADDRDVMERCLGSWSGWAVANEWVSPQQAGIQQCCTGNAARTLYYIWDSVVTADASDTWVNLLLNRASPWLDVDSHLPYEGKVVIKNKTAKKLSVRIPEGTPREQVACDVNAERRKTAWSGNYVEIGGLKKGDLVTVEFPLLERSLFRVIGDLPYRLTLKGNTVVGIDPEGRICPLYQRDHYKANKAPMKKMTRFVSEEIIRRPKSHWPGFRPGNRDGDKLPSSKPQR
ncbi:MAG: glycoside hydrolase family 127 protein [Verrucomicrobia bacterium]|nr:glycoside hydrolase family 127 protein [Verrucomicrobiota bacterium]